MELKIQPFSQPHNLKMPKKKTKKAPDNVNVNVNMKPRMVEIVEELRIETGCSTRAELVRLLVREEAKRRNIPLTKKRKR